MWLHATSPVIRDMLPTRCLLAITTLIACSHKEIDGTNGSGRHTDCKFAEFVDTLCGRRMAVSPARGACITASGKGYTR